jgi:beta-lactamase regulating signal transducer with metallopeptidase domain/WD40 repeat protein
MNEVINSCLTALNSIGRGFCDYTAGIFVQSSVLIVLLLIVDFLLRKRVRAVFRYCVWMLVFVKLILPPTLSLPTGIGYWYGDYLSTDSPVLQQVSNVVRPEPVITPAPEDFALSAEIPQDQPSQTNPQIAAPVTSAVSGLNALTWQAFVFLLWLVGVLVISVLLIQRMLFVKGLVAQSEPAKNRLVDVLNQCRRKVGIRRNIELRLTNNISCPAVCGLFKPVILIPTALLEKLSPDKLRAVLIHELVHIKRADIWVNLVQTVLQIIYFYNPFVWLANAVVRRVREQAVDEMVLVALGAGAKNYSNTLIDIAEMAFWKTSLSLRLIGVVESKKALQRRIRHMLNRPIPKNARVGVLGTIVIIIIATVLLPMTKAQKSNKADTAVAKPARHITIRQVWSGTGVDTCGAPSPDGRYLSYVDWDTGDLAIYEIATGKKRRLTNKGPWDESDEFAEFSRWSPDGKQIVYDWFNKNDFIDLCIIGLDGSKPRILYSNEEVDWAQTYGWSPDGKKILACFSRKDETDQIVLVSAADGSVRVLKTLDNYYPENMSFSPDGRYIVYDFPQKEDSPERDISLLTFDGSREISLIKHPAYDYVLGWAPDGKNILFASNRTGNFDVWVIQVSDGKPQGTPELVKPDIGRFHLMGLGFTMDGSFYYCHRPNKTDVYITEIDPETGKIVVPPHEAIKSFVESNALPDYSPNGKYLAYISRRPPVTMRYTTRPIGNVLCIRSLETGEEREFKPEINRFGFPHWSPDSRSIMVVNWEDDNKHMGHYRIDAQTGEVKLVVMSEANRVHAHEWGADGKSIFLVRTVRTGDRDKDFCQIVVRDIESGEETELYRGKRSDVFTISLSPDGKWLAFLDKAKKRTLRIMPATGGEPREIHIFDKEDNRYIVHTWTADGKYILMPKFRPPKADGKWDLWRIPVEDGEPQNFGFEMASIWQLSAHPDGRHIAFQSSGFNAKSAEIWVIENFLSAGEVASR